MSPLKGSETYQKLFCPGASGNILMCNELEMTFQSLLSPGLENCHLWLVSRLCGSLECKFIKQTPPWEEVWGLYTKIWIPPYMSLMPAACQSIQPWVPSEALSLYRCYRLCDWLSVCVSIFYKCTVYIVYVYIDVYYVYRYVAMYPGLPHVERVCD